MVTVQSPSPNGSVDSGSHAMSATPNRSRGSSRRQNDGLVRLTCSARMPGVHRAPQQQHDHPGIPTRPRLRTTSTTRRYPASARTSTPRRMGNMDVVHVHHLMAVRCPPNRFARHRACSRVHRSPAHLHATRTAAGVSGPAALGTCLVPATARSGSADLVHAAPHTLEVDTCTLGGLLERSPGDETLE